MAAPERPSTAMRPPSARPAGASDKSPSGSAERDKQSPSGSAERDKQSPSGSAERDKQSPSGSAERDRQSPSGSAERDKQSLPELGKELIDLTVTYAKQETIDPLRTVGRRVGLGVLGSGLASVGLIFLLIGVLRLVQVEARLAGTMSWVPYLAAVVVAGGVAAFALKQIGSSRGR